MANRYSRIFHHISINDVKKNREIVVERRRVQFEKKKRDEEYIVEKMKDKKSDWRNELKEQPVFKAVPVDTGKMTSSQSFAVFTNFGGDDSDTGLRFSIDGGLGGTESLPIFNYPLEAGGTVPAIDFSTPVGSGTAQINLGDFSLSGYAMPLGGEMYRSITQRKKEEINKELDSSEEYTKQIKADALMKARVGDGPAVVKIYKASDFTPGEGLADTYPPEQLQKFSVENPQKFSEYKHIFDISDEITKTVEKSFEKIEKEYNDVWEPKLFSLLPRNQYSNLYKEHGASAFSETSFELNRLYNEEQKAMTRVKTKDGIKLRSNKKSNAIRATANKISDAIPTLQELQNKLDKIRQSKMDVVEAKNRREIKALQKAAPKFFFPGGELKPLDLYIEPFGADLKTMDDIEKYSVTDEELKALSDVQKMNLQDLPQNKVLEIIAKLGRYQTAGLSLPFDLTIKYAMGDYTPVTKSPGRAFNNVTLRAIENAHIKYPGRNSVSSDNYVDMPSRFAQAAFQKFDYEVTKKGIIVDDTFNFDDPDEGGSTHIGFFAGLDHLLPDKIKAQTIATNLVKIGDKRAEMLGYDPRDKEFGIPIRYLIPYSQLSQKQKKLFYPERFRKENKRGSTFNRIKEKRNK